jgi:hypothetical protein
LSAFGGLRLEDGRTQTVGAALAEERGHLLSCVTEGFDLAEVAFPLVDKQGCITVKTNFYSVPARAGARVEARIHPLHVEVWHTGRLIAAPHRPGPGVAVPRTASRTARRISGAVGNRSE